MTPSLLLLLAALPAAHAVPAALTTQGRLLDSADQPVEDTLDVSFRIVDAETGGSTLWEEQQSVTFTNGFYTARLGEDESGNPLDDETLDQWPLWLEVQIDGAPAMVPRTPLASVPYARLAGSAEAVTGGPVDASSVSIGGTEVIDSSGAWVGDTPDVAWGDVTAVPSDFADGDDADALSDLVCSDGQWAVFDASAAAWMCDGFSDTTLSDTEVVAAVEAGAVDLAPGSSMDGYTLLAEESAIDWSWLTSVPTDLSDGDDDTLAALSCADEEVAAWDAATSAWVCATDATLDEATVEGMITDGALDLAAGTTVDGVSLGDSTTPGCTLTSTSGTTASLDCGGTAITVDRTPVYDRILAASTDFWCALDTEGYVHCSVDPWGHGAVGEVLDATMDYNSSYDQLDMCVVDTTGAATCYSADGATQPVSGTGYTEIAGDIDDGCVIDAVGAPSCWGSASLTGTYDSITGVDGGRLCGITTTGALHCDFPGRTYGISDAGPWDWVDLRSDTICAGDSAGATSCYYQTAGGVTAYPVAGNWSSFSGRTWSSSITEVYGCGVLTTGTMRCKQLGVGTIDHAGAWSDVVHIRQGRGATFANIPVGINADGALFNSSPM
jgi:hypothetical protein